MGSCGALSSRRIDLCLLNTPTAAAQRGKYNPLAVMANERLESLHDVPTAARTRSLFTDSPADGFCARTTM